MTMLILLQLIHGDFVNVAGMVNDIDTMSHTLSDGITSSGMGTDPGYRSLAMIDGV